MTTLLKKNTFKEALIAKRLQTGMWCTICDPLVAEMIGSMGFDWLLFDTEHSPMDPISVLPLLQAVAPYPVSPMVRPGSLNPAEIKKLLDLGAQNILVPYIQTVEDAELAAASVTYPPHGIRGVSGMTRANRFADIAGYHQAAREEIALIIQVETVEAAEHIEAMAKVDGIDGIFVGPADLAASMGYAGEPSHPEVQKACIEAVKRITAAGIPAGFMSADLSFVEKIIEAGAVFVSRDIDMIALKRGINERHNA